MFHYYQTHPSTDATLNGSTQTQATTSSKTPTISEFDKHCETLLSDDMEDNTSPQCRGRCKGNWKLDLAKLAGGPKINIL